MVAISTAKSVEPLRFASPASSAPALAGKSLMAPPLTKNGTAQAQGAGTQALANDAFVEAGNDPAKQASEEYSRSVRDLWSKLNADLMSGDHKRFDWNALFNIANNAFADLGALRQISTTLARMDTGFAEFTHHPHRTHPSPTPGQLATENGISMA